MQTGINLRLFILISASFSGLNDVYGYENGDRIHPLLWTGSRTVRSVHWHWGVAADRFQALVDQKNLEPAALGKLLQYQVQIGEEQVGNIRTPMVFTIFPSNASWMFLRLRSGKNGQNKISNQYVQPYAIYQEDMKTEYEQKNLAL